MKVDPTSILKNMSMFIFSNSFGMLISFITGVYIARVLGAGPYGQISFAVAITTLFYNAIDSGPTYYATTQVSSGRDTLKKTVETIYPFRLAVATTSFILICIIAFLFVPDGNRLLVILYGASVFPVAVAFDWTFQATGQTRYAGAARLLYTISMLVLVVLFVTDPSNILLVPAFQFLGLSLAVIVMCLIYRRKNGILEFRLAYNEWPGIMKAAAPLGMTGIMTMVAWYVPFIALQYARGDVELGYFTAADQIISAGIAVYGWYFYCIYPMLVKAAGNPDAVHGLSAKFVIGTITPVCVGGAMLADQIIVFIFGDAFLPAGPLLVLMLISLWLLVLNQVFIFGLFSMEKQAIASRIFGIQCIATVALSILLVPWLGTVGACLAAIGCEVAGLPFFYHEFAKKISIRLVGPLLRIAIPAGAMAIAIVSVQGFGNILVSIIVGGVVFVSGAVATDYITASDIETIKGAAG